MIVKSITLTNFRPYYGTQRMFFSTDRVRNVTVIHGENGSGKTALLKALNWCLYEADLPEPHRVINEFAAAEAPSGKWVEASVQLKFEDGEKDYTVRRVISARKLNDGTFEHRPPALEVTYIDEEGRTVTPKNPQDLIRQILPERLRNHFFFDGEHIDNLSKQEGVEEIRSAIKVLMGLEILERTKTHIDDVKKRFREEIAHYGDSESRKAEEEIQGIEEQIMAKQGALKTLKDNRAATEKELEAVRSRLRTLEASRELQTKKEALENRIRVTQENISRINRELVHLSSQKGYLAFCADLISKTKMTLDQKRQKGEIPSGIKRQFVDDLLKKGECICGQTLDPGSPHYERVLGWRNVASSKDLDDAFIDMTGDTKLLENERPRLYEEIRRLYSSKEQERQALGDTREELSEITGQLEGKDAEEVSALALQERNLRAQISDIDQSIGRETSEIQALEKAKELKEKEFQGLKTKNDKAETARKRMEACEAIREAVSRVLEVQSEDVKQRLQKRITDVYSRMFRKGYEVTLDKNYMLTVTKTVEQKSIAVELSQGERQVTSLSFIGALVDLAREQYDDRSVYFRGGQYPIVMDSPFGQLDKDHQSRIAQGIPSLARQVIVMATDSQWNGPVETGMKPFIGKEYWLQYYSPTSDQSVPYEHTAVQEV